MHATQPLCSDLFNLVWDTLRTGRPRLHRTGAGLTLAGGLLAELVLAECLAVDGEHLVVLGHERPRDPLLADMLRLIAGECGRHSALLTWLDYLGREEYISRVADRLIVAGVIVRDAPGRFSLRRDVRYVHASQQGWATCSWPATRLRYALRDRRLAPGDRDLVLAALADAAELTTTILEDPEERGRQQTFLRQALQDLPAQIQPVVAGVRTAIGKAVLTHRT
ncbi:GPP34 family phosphoprotein [Nonomuraea sp. NPDC050310]|uniref:GOLPH3/VPS74 family protein n=1 Tax=Nonomuraea sp. NPDC050310 TaxID=3154935 RepID=UPI0033CE0566